MHSLSDFSLPGFTIDNIKGLTDLSNTLRPLDVAIKELGEDSATLIEFEGVLQFVINNLVKANNSITNDLLERLNVGLMIEE